MVNEGESEEMEADTRVRVVKSIWQIRNEDGNEEAKWMRSCWEKKRAMSPNAIRFKRGEEK